MKKIKTTLLMILVTVAVQAQDENQNNFDPFKNRDFIMDALHICTTLIGLYIVTSFILSLIRSGLDKVPVFEWIEIILIFVLCLCGHCNHYHQECDLSFFHFYFCFK